MQPMTADTSESIMPKRDDELPDVPLAPAPWTLTGHGWILLVKLPQSALDDPAFVPPGLRGKRHGRYAMVMLVDYETSAVGPYRELLYIPGRFDFLNGRHYSITRIYVSTMNSVVNGRINWGIPKNCCDFDFHCNADGDDLLSVSHEGQRFAYLHIHPSRLRLPFTTALLPRFLRTLSQYYGGRQFTYIPSASGQMQFSRVMDMQFDGKLFPDLVQGKVVICVKTPRFQMGFPVSAIAPQSA